jgi:N-acetylneuraminic acid mutarotase
MKNKLLPWVLMISGFASCTKNHGPQQAAPAITAISPMKGAPGTPVVISGGSFDTVAAHISVKFNGAVAMVYAVTTTSITVIVPAGATTGKITLTMHGSSASSNGDFEILPGGWVQKASLPYPLPPGGRAGGIGFAIGNFGYMGFGTDNGSDYDDLYRYDPAADSWTKRSSMGTGMEDLVCMVINNKAYVGIGKSRQLADNTTLFYEYDPSTDNWTRKKDFPGVKREAALGLAIGGMGYVGLGHTSDNNYLYDIWQYDPSSDTWTPKKNFPSPSTCPQLPFGFSLDGQVGYVGGSVNSVWWQYDPAGDTWSQKNNFPGDGMAFASTMVLNGNGYVMGGLENWKYIPSTDAWTQLAFFGARNGGSTFVINGNGYFGLGSGIPGYFHTDLWRYTP